MAPPIPPTPPDPKATASNAPPEDAMETEHSPLPHVPSVFLTFLASVIGNPSNRAPNGTLHINPNSLSVIQQMMAAEATRLAQMDKRMDQMAKLLETFKARLGSLENACGLVATRKPAGTSTGQKSYAGATG
ncbi:uncharacterized protein VP01_6377g1, partial [Puccinia sorghi]